MSLIHNLGRAETHEDGVEYLVKDLENCIKTIGNINSILTKSKNFRSFDEAELYKKIEDGILDSIHIASRPQLDVMLRGGYKFKFYTELNDNENLKREIQRKLRDNKLKDLIK